MKLEGTKKCATDETLTFGAIHIVTRTDIRTKRSLQFRPILVEQGYLLEMSTI